MWLQLESNTEDVGLLGPDGRFLVNGKNYKQSIGLISDPKTLMFLGICADRKNFWFGVINAKKNHGDLEFLRLEGDVATKEALKIMYTELMRAETRNAHKLERKA